jgi:hypothetical protein
MSGLPQHRELLERIERELIDSYDEELELEIEDRDPDRQLEPGLARALHDRPRRLGEPAMIGAPLHLNAVAAASQSRDHMTAICAASSAPKRAEWRDQPSTKV